MSAEDAILQQVLVKSYNKKIYQSNDTWTHPFPGRNIRVCITAIGSGDSGVSASVNGNIGLHGIVYSGAGGNGGALESGIYDVVDDITITIGANSIATDGVFTLTAIDGDGHVGQAGTSETFSGGGRGIRQGTLLAGAGGNGYMGFGNGGHGGNYFNAGGNNPNLQTGQAGQAGAVIIEWWV